jgi:hypothetical protein
VFTVYNPDCERAGVSVDRGGPLRNGGAWLDVRCRPEGCARAPQGLVAFYPFDEASGDSAADLANAADAAALRLHGVVRESGRVMGGVHLPWSTWAEGAPGKNLGTGDFSIALWARIAPGASFGLVSLLDKRDLSPIRGYHLALSGGEPLVQLADAGIFDGWYNYHSQIPGTRVMDGAWHFLAVTVARASHEGIRWYLDGAPAGMVADPTDRPGSLSSASPLFVGRRSFSNDGWMDGSLDELQIYSRVLSPDEISVLLTRQICR